MSRRNFIPKKVLLSTGELFRYIHGANMVFLELAEYFLSLGCEVYIYTNLALPPMLDEALSLEGADRLKVIDDPEQIVDDDFDLIFMHDNTLPDNIVRQLGQGVRTRIVPLHLSPFVHIEMPLFPQIENTIADVIACVSKETSIEMVRRGLDSRKIWVMENFVPSSMTEVGDIRSQDSLRRVAVVTNHLASELKGAMELLRNSGIQVDHFGDEGRSQKVTPDILRTYDAIISIGKTVQYGLSLGVPMYLYDHFGGPGWLMASNFESELDFNFSGRASREQKTAQEIAEELQSEFTGARQYALANYLLHQDRFAISSKMNALMELLPLRARIKKITTTDELAWTNFNQIYRGMYRGFEYYKDESMRK